MKQNNASQIKIDVSYELYRELAGDICSPLDNSNMTLELRFELYTSKLIYLINIQEQCFRCINTEKDTNTYTIEDLLVIQDAIDITKEFIRQTVREKILNSLNKAEKKALYASRNQFNS